jgi:hypothetical protein
MPAIAIDFNFSFKNALNDAGTVTGVIRGLEEGSGAATSVEVLTNTGGYGLGEYVGNPTNNFWTVLGGNLVAFNFTSFGSRNTPPAVTNASLYFSNEELLGNPISIRAGINADPTLITIGRPNVTREDINLTFSRVNAFCQ